jgi:hypothetical protein
MKISLQTWILFLSFCLCTALSTVAIHALTVEQIKKLKGAGVEDRTIQMLIEQEELNQEGTEAVGVKETTRPDGGRDKIYYSVTTAEEERKIQQEEREKMENALEILRNIIIDDRRR